PPSTRPADALRSTSVPASKHRRTARHTFHSYSHPSDREFRDDDSWDDCNTVARPCNARKLYNDRRIHPTERTLDMTFSFPDHHALGTGGTSGIGRAGTLALAAAGCRVTTTGVNPTEVESFPPTAGVTAAVLDVNDDGAVGKLVAGLPRLDIQVNAAG